MGGRSERQPWRCGAEGASVLPNRRHSSGIGCFEACVRRLRSRLIPSLPRDPVGVAVGRERASEGRVCCCFPAGWRLLWRMDVFLPFWNLPEGEKDTGISLEGRGGTRSLRCGLLGKLSVLPSLLPLPFHAGFLVTNSCIMTLTQQCPCCGACRGKGELCPVGGSEAQGGRRRWQSCEGPSAAGWARGGGRRLLAKSSAFLVVSQHLPEGPSLVAAAEQPGELERMLLGGEASTGALLGAGLLLHTLSCSFLWQSRLCSRDRQGSIETRVYLLCLPPRAGRMGIRKDKVDEMVLRSLWPVCAAR